MNNSQNYPQIWSPIPSIPAIDKPAVSDASLALTSEITAFIFLLDNSVTNLHWFSGVTQLLQPTDQKGSVSV